MSTTIPPGYEPVDEPGQLPPGYAPVVPPPVQPAPPPPLVGEPPDVGPEEPDQGPHCLFGGLCFGPVLTAGALDVFGIGAHARTEHWGVGIDYQFVRFTAKGIPIRLSLLTIEGRLYPFGGAFFIAGGLAWQDAVLRGHVSYQGDSRVPPIETDAHGEVSVPVFKVGLGFMGRSGFVMGIDLALGLQLGRTRVTFSSDLPRIQPVLDVEESIRQRADTWVRALPFLLQVNLLRFGVLF